VLVLGLVLGLGGAAIIDHGRNSGGAAPATTLPARRPATTAPPATSPATTPDTPDTPDTTAPASTPDTTTGGRNTSRTASLSVGVVDINTVLAYDRAEAAGTGMIITADGEVLTNNHVVEGSTSISVTVVSTGKTYKASVVGTDPSHDVALIKMENASGLTPINMGDSTTVQVGDAVTAVGNAGGTGTLSAGTAQITGLDASVTAGSEDGTDPET
jgi:S1-C subfamily serine protease